MIIPSLKKIKDEELNLLWVDAIREWAKAPPQTRHWDLAIAVADELERRGKDVPTDQVQAEIELLLDLGLRQVEALLKEQAK
jgi:hypothetical protein